MKFRDIPQLTRDGTYQVNVAWRYLEEWLSREIANGLDIDPPFQRAHVWTEQQQIAFVEFSLRGGKGSNLLRFNCVGWNSSYEGPFVLVDGKQRLQAVRRFMANEIGVFGGHRLSDFEDKMRPMEPDLVLMVNDLPNTASVLQ